MSEARIQQLKSFAQADPGDTFTRFALALEYLKQDDVGQAEKIFLDIMVAQPDYTGVYYHLGKIYELKKEPEEAKRIYSKGIVICRNEKDNHSLQELQQALDEISDQGE